MHGPMYIKKKKTKTYKCIIYSLWIIGAWRCILPEVTVRVDGTDDDMLWNGSEEVGNVRSECKEDAGTDCEDGDSDTDR